MSSANLIEDMTVWCLVGDYGDGGPSAGPFNTRDEAEAYDPTDDSLEVRRIRLTAWIESVARIRATQEMRALAEEHRQVEQSFMAGLMRSEPNSPAERRLNAIMDKHRHIHEACEARAEKIQERHIDLSTEES